MLSALIRSPVQYLSSLHAGLRSSSARETRSSASQRIKEGGKYGTEEFNLRLLDGRRLVRLRLSHFYESGASSSALDGTAVMKAAEPGRSAAKQRRELNLPISLEERHVFTSLRGDGGAIYAPRSSFERRE